MKSGNLNFLELSGPLQDCNGTLYLYLISLYYVVMCRLVLMNSCGQRSLILLSQKTHTNKDCILYR